MLKIKQFEEERQAWEKERSELEEKLKAVSSQKDDFDAREQPLLEELERLRQRNNLLTAQSEQGGGGTGQRINHEQQLEMMELLDSLRNDLREEKAKHQQMQRRSSELEATNGALRQELSCTQKELDMTMQGSTASAPPRRTTCSGVDIVERLGLGQELDCTINTTKACTPDSNNLRDELMETKRGVEAKQMEVLTLEDRNLKLREELNTEKQKVVELKRRAESKRIAWKAELEKIVPELREKQRVEEDLALLKEELLRHREEARRFREEAAERERLHQLELERLRSEVAAAGAQGKASASKIAQEEMNILSTVVGGQLIAVEQELSSQMKAQNELMERFLLHIHEPLKVLRSISRGYAADGAAGNELWARQAPPLFDPPGPGADLAAGADFRDKLVQVFELLCYCAEVLAAQKEGVHNKQIESWNQSIEAGKAKVKELLGAAGSVLTAG